MLTLTSETVQVQIKELLERYPGLEVVERKEDGLLLRGKIHVFRTAQNFTLDQTYRVEIRVPINSDALPTVISTDGAIDVSYPHRYNNGTLCLETDTAARMRFADGFNLTQWVDEFVEPYFFSYEYHCRYGVFPFGERPHGINGLLDTYQGIFDESDLRKVFILARYVCDGEYRGHIDCPCGSGKKLRNCHGPSLFPIMTNPRKKAIVVRDLQTIREEIEKYAVARNNQG